MSLLFFCFYSFLSLISRLVHRYVLTLSYSRSLRWLYHDNICHPNFFRILYFLHFWLFAMHGWSHICIFIFFSIAVLNPYYFFILLIALWAARGPNPGFAYHLSTLFYFCIRFLSPHWSQPSRRSLFFFSFLLTHSLALPATQKKRQRTYHDFVCFAGIRTNEFPSTGALVSAAQPPGCNDL